MDSLNGLASHGVYVMVGLLNLKQRVQFKNLSLGDQVENYLRFLSHVGLSTHQLIAADNDEIKNENNFVFKGADLKSFDTI